MKRMLLFLPVAVLFILAPAARTLPYAQGEPAAYAGFVDRAAALVNTAAAYRAGTATAAELRAAVGEARRAYKRTAWLTEFYYPSFATKHFNGAPLLKAEKYGTHSTVEPPEGLQVLDELAYADAPNAQQLLTLARQLHNQAVLLAAEVAARPYPLDEVVEALRTELVRIPTLYLTGFDTPGSLAGISESRASLQALAGVLAEQQQLDVWPAHAAVLSQLTAAAAALEHATDFAAFDRLAFQRDHLNGIYRGLGELQRQAGLPAAVRFPTGRDPRGQTLLYADDFLDPYAYTELTAGEDNPALRALGRELFYDAGLSRSGTLSCASCHQPERGFTDGADGTRARNAPTLMNAVYADRYFYDLRAFSLEQQAEHVIYDHGEFDTDYAGIVEKLRADDAYRHRFRVAFRDRRPIDHATFSAALASYVLSLRSFNSPFDRYARGETDDLDPAAQVGYNLFMGKAACGTCHFAPTFAGLVPPAFAENESEILGVPADPHAWTKTLDPDRGRAAGGLAHEAVWIYERSFKTPTVRNAAVTAPYFHNGAYHSLDLVVDFYDRGGGEGLGLAVSNQTLPPDPLQLSGEEKQALVAFLEALTDVPDPAGLSETRVNGK
ncbi:cytochrome-c peroxidase [Lewinella sp. IMCC34183]|uniref:cytochrome-c peroxidase n=1 Tax=Lewinella sp. IMCC34183 TaxID=2248762 RepID=UPI000E27E2B5|nr:cytochrome c peroxidase [Lewinella sp. IMCC34183]